MRIGQGYDVHRFTQNRKLILGGVNIPYEYGLLGHSDADVLLHAISDALLGAAALGDIGKHFPDSDVRFKDIDSKIILQEACSLVRKKGYEISNIDATVVLQKPKIAEYVDEMKNNIAKFCALDSDCINVKATTEEKLGFTGSGEGASAHAVCLIYKK